MHPCTHPRGTPWCTPCIYTPVTPWVHPAYTPPWVHLPPGPLPATVPAPGSVPGDGALGSREEKALGIATSELSGAQKCLSSCVFCAWMLPALRVRLDKDWIDEGCTLLYILRERDLCAKEVFLEKHLCSATCGIPPVDQHMRDPACWPTYAGSRLVLRNMRDPA